MLAGEIRPYSVSNSSGVVPGILGQRSGSLKSRRWSPLSSAMRKTMLMTPALDVVEIEYPRQQERPHVGDRCTHRVALLAEKVPEDHGTSFEGIVAELQLDDALLDLRVHHARLTDPGQVTLDVGHEDGDADAAEMLGHDLSVTVLPVPVAPVTRPWRLAIRGRRSRSFSPLAISMPSSAMDPSSVPSFVYQLRLSRNRPVTVRCSAARKASTVEISSPVQ